MFIARRALRARYYVAGCLLSAVISPAHAQGFPACKTLRLVIAYPAGGPTDTQGRIIAQKLGEKLGQSIVVENRGGGGTVIATAFVAKSPPDGCTLLLTAAPFAINPIVISSLPYDSAKDLAPVTQTARFPQMLVVHPVLPVKTVKDLVALAAATPGGISYASSGNLGTGHLAGELLNSMAGINLQHISCKGSAPRATLRNRRSRAGDVRQHRQHRPARGGGKAARHCSDHDRAQCAAAASPDCR